MYFCLSCSLPIESLDDSCAVRNLDGTVFLFHRGSCWEQALAVLEQEAKRNKVYKESFIYPDAALSSLARNNRGYKYGLN